jgi:hypothetical protein
MNLTEFYCWPFLAENESCFRINFDHLNEKNRENPSALPLKGLMERDYLE